MHAQFETIHPFTDGNGRVGRALIHTVLTRRGLTARAVLPVSLVLATLSDRYIDGLTSYRYLGAPDSTAARIGLDHWIEIFLDAVDSAAGQALHLADEITVLRDEWGGRLAAYRAGLGKPKRPEPRADSTTARILQLLPETPVLTSASVQRALGASPPAAKQALDELANAAILGTTSLDRRTTGYIARSVLDLAAYTERALASTRFDTRGSAPSRPAPARPRTPRSAW
ncbi:Fic family protein [Nocardia sp. SSK8]|uniref:Fic family protein n=1 Tax=Nocardia sp. SSK8 TaxID=3120154 RepID=UPI003FA55873